MTENLQEPLCFSGNSELFSVCVHGRTSSLYYTDGTKTGSRLVLSGARQSESEWALLLLWPLQRRQKKHPPAAKLQSTHCKSASPTPTASRIRVSLLLIKAWSGACSTQNSSYPSFFSGRGSPLHKLSTQQELLVHTGVRLRRNKHCRNVANAETMATTPVQCFKKPTGCSQISVCWLNDRKVHHKGGGKKCKWAAQTAAAVSGVKVLCLCVRFSPQQVER